MDEKVAQALLLHYKGINMKRTVYQVWRYNPLKEEWFRYAHIPDCNSQEVCASLLEQHKRGEYKANQFKHWMQDSKFKIVRAEMQFTDV